MIRNAGGLDKRVAVRRRIEIGEEGVALQELLAKKRKPRGGHEIGGNEALSGAVSDHGDPARGCCGVP
ncbi:MAG: hypothetical protein M1396_01595 [Chloroflexi bacterium]|nr:hypothetical protein [Chloroflexota bacterium]